GNSRRTSRTGSSARWAGGSCGTGGSCYPRRTCRPGNSGRACRSRAARHTRRSWRSRRPRNRFWTTGSWTASASDILLFQILCFFSMKPCHMDSPYNDDPIIMYAANDKESLFLSHLRKIFLVFQIPWRLRLILPRQLIIMLRQFKLSHSVITDAQRNGRQETVTFLLNKSP